MNEFIALTYFLCSQQRSILALEEWLDSNLQKIYYLANQIFKRFNQDIEDQAEVALDVCDKIELLLRKISQSNKENDRRKVEKYVESGMEFISKRRKTFEPKENEEAVTPIESIESADLFFI
ncbi:hypothetical protein RMATCC62417_06078 [Rhizopus microsporus]|nr:hypothetical protein RMATCC62417_06078 [Rhizopus microsporus]